MGKRSKGRVFLSGVAEFPEADDPRLLDVDDALRMADELAEETAEGIAASPRKPKKDQNAQALGDRVWVKHNRTGEARDG